MCCFDRNRKNLFGLEGLRNDASVCGVRKFNLLFLDPKYSSKININN